VQIIILAKLANDHIERVSQHELNQQRKLKERRETFEEAFKEDLEEYKATGSIPSMHCASTLLYIYIYVHYIYVYMYVYEHVIYLTLSNL